MYNQGEWRIYTSLELSLLSTTINDSMCGEKGNVNGNQSESYT